MACWCSLRICSIGAVETANQIPQSWLIQAANAPVLQWVFQRNLERVLYGRDDGGSTGPIWKIRPCHRRPCLMLSSRCDDGRAARTPVASSPTRRL